MNFYLVDDDSNIRNILKLIIRDRKLGNVCGSCGDPVEALEDISFAHPDIVIVDLLMPEMDGISFVSKLKQTNPDIAFIMLSQVSSKDMISDAYESGIEFYIHKPINSVEVESVIRTVCQTVTMRQTLEKMQSLLSHDLKQLSNHTAATVKQTEKKYITKLKNVLQKLGIIGEIGSKDIIALIDFLVEHGQTVDDSTLNELCGQFSDNPKSVEQRIRRAANAGMVNLAHLGLEDYSNDIFMEYSTTLYNFEQVRKEMDFIRGKSDKHGNVKIKNFLNALMLYSQN
ncbi:response regulator [Coprococcus sp. AF21-14LB]|uniref:response regulator n=1 Tax=Coprococcus sp. AF21-14LB TaxID=2292231 RepID=UPI000E5331D9|nr:response regulator [Coprococcus sp. AF21-14LB]RGS80110.1 response regulator [Coprococcus sp. AF21-14LB]